MISRQEAELLAETAGFRSTSAVPRMAGGVVFTVLGWGSSCSDFVDSGATGAVASL